MTLVPPAACPICGREDLPRDAAHWRAVAEQYRAQANAEIAAANRDRERLVARDAAVERAEAERDAAVAALGTLAHDFGAEAASSEGEWSQAFRAAQGLTERAALDRP